MRYLNLSTLLWQKSRGQHRKISEGCVSKVVLAFILSFGIRGTKFVSSALYLNHLKRGIWVSTEGKKGMGQDHTYSLCNSLLRITVKLWPAWLSWLPCKPKCCQFDSWSGTYPQAWSLARASTRGSQSMFLSLSFLPPFPSL